MTIHRGRHAAAPVIGKLKNTEKMKLKMYFAGVEDPEVLQQKAAMYASELAWGQEGQAEEYKAMCREYDCIKVNIDGGTIARRFAAYNAAKDRRRLARKVIPYVFSAFTFKYEDGDRGSVSRAALKRAALILNSPRLAADADDLAALWGRRKITLGDVADRLAPYLVVPGFAPGGLQHTAAERMDALRQGFARSQYLSDRYNDHTGAMRAEMEALQYCGLDMAGSLAVLDNVDEAHERVGHMLPEWNNCRMVVYYLAIAAAADCLIMDEWRDLYGGYDM